MASSLTLTLMKHLDTKIVEHHIDTLPLRTPALAADNVLVIDNSLPIDNVLTIQHAPSHSLNLRAHLFYSINPPSLVGTPLVS
jgi:hypothetical protein